MPGRRPRVRSLNRRTLADFNRPTGACAELMSLWMLRLMLDGRAIETMQARRERIGFDMLHALGVDQAVTAETDDRGIEAGVEIDESLLQAMRRRHDALMARDVEHTAALMRTIAVVGQRLQLDDCEQRLLAFLVVENQERGLNSIIRDAAEALHRDGNALLAIALGLPEETIRRALSPDATLRRSGLIEQNRGFSPGDCEIGYDLLHGLAADLLNQPGEPEALFRSYFRTVPEPALTADNVPHLADDLATLVALLGRAAREGIAGVNVLLHGPPGTGKTELARLCAATACLEAREINHEDRNGHPLVPQYRQRTYQLCQHLLERDRNALIVFDEVEDVFPAEGLIFLFSGRGEPTGGKSWTNRMLEANPVPAIWITNHPRALDPAYLRRFDYTIELRTPPRSVRKALLQKHCRELAVSPEWIERVAEDSELTPAEIERTTRVARLLGDAVPADRAEAFLDDQLRRRARLQRRKPPVRRRGADALRWDPDYLNAEPAVEPLLEQLMQVPTASLLLHGIPGTGKTALAEHIARQADRPLIKRPASALLSPWLGETEQNIANLFDDAMREGAVLLLDEADSLLRSRDGARARYEVTQTNELLVQIEAFEGILICATNHLDALDSAVLRRFDHKVALHPLKRDQRRRLFVELAQQFGLEVTDNAPTLTPLDSLDNLAPGDFATVARQFRTGTTTDTRAVGATLETLIQALETESGLKPGGGRRGVGFV